MGAGSGPTLTVSVGPGVMSATGGGVVTGAGTCSTGGGETDAERASVRVEGESCAERTDRRVSGTETAPCRAEAAESDPGLSATIGSMGAAEAAATGASVAELRFDLTAR
jgi:hypothetical protein